jgi:hypothetical protein
MRSSRPGLVYFIKPCRFDGPIKIGFSRTPSERLIDITTWSPWPLELMGFVPGSLTDESYLHKCFADHHSHREWFHSSRKLRDAIARILSSGVIAGVPGLSPIGNIRKSRWETMSAERRLCISYRARVRHALKRVDRNVEKGVYFSQPNDVFQILLRWNGTYHQRDTAIQPSLEEMKRLDEFIADPGATAVRHDPPKLRVVS